MIDKNLHKVLLVVLLLSGCYMAAQTGVYTQDPGHPLHIDGADDNAVSPTATQLQNDVVVTSDGKLGVGVLNPVTRVDIRSSDDKGIIGVGTNSQTAAAAGAGAIRYDSGNTLQYSDGLGWHDLPLVLPPKALVLANKSTTQSIAQNNTSQYITNWAVSEDAHGNFNNTNGIFQAPRDGFYIVSFNVTLASAAISNNTRIETIIESNNTTDNIGAYRCVNSYPAWEALLPLSNLVGGSCNAIFNLKTGNTIRFRVWHNLGGSRNLSTANSGTDNSISIYEL